jgi:FKBP-type peptidyl-prolyl cis-trans isomerase (trigger factor)
MVHQRGIEISGKSIDAINKVVAPANKTELQSLIGYQPIQEVLTSAVDTDDWRKKIVDYLKDPYKKVERRIRFQLPSMCSSMMNYIIEL